MTLTFYIIYTPKSFSKLKLAIKSLLLFSPYKFILVGNGLDDKEYQSIDDFSRLHVNLSCIDLPGNITTPHGTALTHLFNTSSSEYFCFMDSDIFAFSDFSSRLEELILLNDVVSSCKPLEWLNKESSKGYRGHNTVSPSNKNIATTYFSVYKRAKVEPIMNNYKISFERYMRETQVPDKAKLMLSNIDKHTWKFNTAKLLNILQAYNNQNLCYQEFDGLIHLGGISRYSEHSIQGTRNINKANLIAVDRVATRYYFHTLLQNIEKNNYSIPELNLKNLELQNLVIETSNHLIQLNKHIQGNISCL